MSTSALAWFSLFPLIALIPPAVWILVSRSGVDVLKDKLRDEYTSAKIRSFQPLPRSSVVLQVEDIYVELLLTRQDAAVRFYHDSDNHRALFLPVDADHRFSWGWWLDLDEYLGMDACYRFLGQLVDSK